MCWVLGLIGHPTRTAAWLCGVRATTCFAQGLVAFMNVLGFSGLGGSEGLVQGFRVETAITASRFQVYSVWRFWKFQDSGLCMPMGYQCSNFRRSYVYSQGV